MKLQRAFFVLLASELVACSTTRVGINYSPPGKWPRLRPPKRT